MNQAHNVTVGDVYVDACLAYGKSPNESGLDAWESVLGKYGAEEVKRALRAWQAIDEIDEFTRRTRGAVMPPPSEIKALILQVRKSELRCSKFIPCGSCIDGWVARTEGGERVMHRCQCFRDWALVRGSAPSCASG